MINVFNTKKVSHWNSDTRVPKFLLPAPKKIGFWAQKRPNLAQNWHFGPNIGIFGPFDLMPEQKTMRTSCLGGFSIMWVPKLLLTPLKIRILAPNIQILGSKKHIFAPSSQLEPRRSMSSTQKRCLIRMRVP